MQARAILSMKEKTNRKAVKVLYRTKGNGRFKKMGEWGMASVHLFGV